MYTVLCLAEHIVIGDMGNYLYREDKSLWEVNKNDYMFTRLSRTWIMWWKLDVK